MSALTLGDVVDRGDQVGGEAAVSSSRGTSGYYRIADESVYALCDLVCGNIARQLERSANDRKAFARVRSTSAPSRPRRG